jgi:membrane protein DedA with SNARE-associated domain
VLRLLMNTTLGAGGPPLSALLGHYGYMALALGVFLESVGLPLPGETALLAAAFLAQRGMFSLAWVVLISAAAVILGGSTGYLIGRRFGRRLVERYGRLVRLTPQRLQSLDTFFVTHGAKTVFFSRFVTGLRVFAAFFAGMTRVPWRKFLLFNVLGGTVWAVVIGGVGYAFAESWELLDRGAGTVAVVLLAAALALHWLRQRRSLAPPGSQESPSR